jgi:hypothetical protein
MTVGGGRVRVGVWGRRVEEALAAGDVPAAAATLSSRPGEVLRRADHLLRIAGTPWEKQRVLAAVEQAAPGVAPAVLLATLGDLRTRTRPRARRLFFPAGRTATAHIIPDERAPLPEQLVDDAVRVLEAEVLRRAAALPAVDLAVIDAELTGLVAPYTERTAARALVTLTRGSTRRGRGPIR